MSNLSDLLPAGASGKTIEAVATATIASKAPVILNSAGTVTAVGGVTGSAGTPVAFGSVGTPDYVNVVYDTDANKVVVFWMDYGNSQYGTAAVGTVTGTALSWGTAVVFNSAETTFIAATFDSDANKTVTAYRDGGASNYGKAIVGTVSGTSISFGTEADFNAASTTNIGMGFDSTANKAVIAFRDDGNSDHGTAVVGTVSGTGISFGSETAFQTNQTSSHNLAHDPDENKMILVYKHNGNSSYGTSNVCTITGTSIAFGTDSIFKTANTDSPTVAYDTTANKAVVPYSISGAGKGVVGTVSGTGITFGTEAEFNAGGSSNIACAYDSTGDVTVVSYTEAVTTFDGFAAAGTVSGTSISFGPALNFTGDVTYSSSGQNTIYDPDANKFVSAYRGAGSVVYTPTTTNVTSFVGIADAGIATSATGTVVVQGGTVSDYPAVPASNSAGTPVVFETAAADKMVATFDSNENKVVIAYQDVGNSDHGTAVVGTVSGTSVSYGTPVVFEAAATSHIAITFDSNSNKVVIAYRDEGNSNYGTAIVGTVSGTSISYGSPVVFESAASARTGATFDSSNNKVVIAYKGGTAMKAIVGTVSSTSISFGTAVQFDASSTVAIAAVTFDSSANKVVIGWQDSGNGSKGTAIVGTVSGTAISFGTEVVFEAADIYYPAATFDSNSNKVVFAYYDGGNSNYGTAIVGTVSGTAISFGTAVVFETAQSSWNSATFDSNTNNVVIAYRDVGNSNYGTAIDGTVSGTSISFGTALVFEADTAAEFAATFDSNSNKVFIAYEDQGNSNYGTGVVYTSKGPSLTIGSKYYVQNDGTISTVSSSVNAGLAISTTSLLINGDS